MKSEEETDKNNEREKEVMRGDHRGGNKRQTV